MPACGVGSWRLHPRERPFADTGLRQWLSGRLSTNERRHPARRARAGRRRSHAGHPLQPGPGVPSAGALPSRRRVRVLLVSAGDGRAGDGRERPVGRRSGRPSVHGDPRAGRCRDVPAPASGGRAPLRPRADVRRALRRGSDGAAAVARGARPPGSCRRPVARRPGWSTARSPTPAARPWPGVWGERVSLGELARECGGVAVPPVHGARVPARWGSRGGTTVHGVPARATGHSHRRSSGSPGGGTSRRWRSISGTRATATSRRSSVAPSASLRPRCVAGPEVRAGS